MDPLTILFAYFSTWVNSLNYTLGAAVIALAFLYFTRTLPVGQRIAIPAITGVFVSVLGTGVLFPASALPQLGYPLCLFALGSGGAIGYLAVTTFTKRNLGWVLIIVASHLAAYCVMLSAGFVPLVGGSVFGFFLAAMLFCTVFPECSPFLSGAGILHGHSGGYPGRRRDATRFSANSGEKKVTGPC